MPNYDETVEFIMPEGRGTAKGTNFTTGSKGGGALAGAASDEYTRNLEQKRDENIIRDFGMEGLVSYYDKRIKKDQAEQAERDALKTRALQQEKLAAESMKLTGEALEAMSKAQRGPVKTSTEWAAQAAGSQRPGESPEQHAERVLQATPEARANVARNLPSVPASTRDKLATLETTMKGLKQLRTDHDPVFTGQEAPVGKIGKFVGMENPAFARFRARAQMIYAPARNDLIGATQSPEEIKSIDRVLPPDITKLSDIEAVEAMNVLSEMTKTKLDALKHQFRLEQPSPAILQKPGAHPLTGSKPGSYRSSTGRTVNWDGTKEVQ